MESIFVVVVVDMWKFFFGFWFFFEQWMTLQNFVTHATQAQCLEINKKKVSLLKRNNFILYIIIKFARWSTKQDIIKRVWKVHLKNCDTGVITLKILQ